MTIIEATVKNLATIIDSDRSEGLKLIGVLSIIAVLLAELIDRK